MDVKTAFLNGVIEEDAYIEQPQGFEVHDREKHVFNWRKPYMGWSRLLTHGTWCIDSYPLSLGSKKSDVDLKLYFKVFEDNSLMFFLYVDDLFLTGAKVLIVQCKRELIFEFKIKDLGLMHY